MEITTITNAQTIAELVTLVEAENAQYDAMMPKALKMPKVKALELIAQSYPDYEVDPVCTVRGNLEAAHGSILAAAGVKEIALQTTEVEVKKPTLPTKSIGILLQELAHSTDAKAKKNIRAALRRQGYYVGSKSNKTEAE